MNQNQQHQAKTKTYAVKLPDEVPAPVPVPVEVPPGYWEREGVHAPKPTMRMWQSLVMETRNKGARQACRELGMLSDGIEFRVIGGWEYRRRVPPGGKDRPPPIWLMPIFCRIVPSLRLRVRGCIELARSPKELPVIRQWHDERKQALTKRMAELRSIDLAVLSHAALDEHVSRVLVPFFKESFRYHFLLNVVFVVSLGRIVVACRELLGWDDLRVIELLSGLSEKSSEPARRLAEVTRMAAERPRIRALLERVDDGAVNRLAEADPEFARAFEDYRREFGCRTLQYSFHEPTLAETAVLLLGLVRDQVVRKFDAVSIRSALDDTRAAAVSEARAALADRPAEERERFEWALAGAELAYPLREDNQYYTVSGPTALVRYGLLELGNRLTDRHLMGLRDDVFFLELEEALSGFREDKALLPLVARRKTEFEWAETHPGPPSYGKDPGPPRLSWLPADVQRFIEAQLWVVREMFRTGQDGQAQTTQSTLHGIAASPGRYTGPARVIMSESEFGKLHASDVLVCPTTSPVWSILFPSIGALITDTGGALSHPAIIAREYRIPAVVATGNATSLLHDGQRVTVDGSNGTVEVLS